MNRANTIRFWALSLIICVCCSVFFSSTPANAAIGDTYVTLPGVGVYKFGANMNEICPITAAELFSSHQLAFASRIVPCISDMIRDTGRDFIQRIHSWMGNLVTYTLMLAVVLYGAMVAMGAVEKLTRDTMTLLLKVVLIIFFTENLTLVLDWVLGGLDSMLEYVTNYFTLGDFLSTSGIGLHCKVEWSIWSRMDCLFNTIIGIAYPMTLSNGLLAFFFNSFFSGPLGAVMAIIGVFFAVNLMLGLLQAAYTYLIAVTSIVLLVMMGGIFIPLILFKSTKAYFQTWAKMLASMIIQPVILFMFLNVVITAFDIIIFSGDNSLYWTIAGKEIENPDFDMNDYLDGKDVYGEKNLGYMMDLHSTMFATGAASGDGGATTELVTNSAAESARLREGDVSNFNVGIPFQTIDWEKLSAARNPPPEKIDDSVTKGFQMELLSAFLVAGLASFVLLSMLSVIPSMAVDLGGGQNQTVDAAGTASRSISQGVASVTGSAGKGFGSLVGRR